MTSQNGAYQFIDGSFVPSGKTEGFKILLILMIVFCAPMAVAAEEQPTENKVLRITQKMAAVFQKVQDYSCEVEEIFYGEGIEDPHYRFKYFFKKGKKIRVDFFQPYRGTTVLYIQGTKKVTVIPFSFLPIMRFRISIENPMVKTPTGQTIDQTDMGYFIDFLFQNVRNVKQEENEYQEDGERVSFLFWALDYIKREKLQKYKIVISKSNWFPMIIERYDLNGNPIDTAHIKNCLINTHLDDSLFNP